MFRKVFIVLIASILASSAFAQEKNSQVEFWNSSEGMKKLERSEFKNDFYQLINFYQAQVNPLYCGAATGSTILNALNYGSIESQKELEITKPESLGGGTIPFALHLQKNFFNEKTDKVKKREIINLETPKSKVDGKDIYDPGLTLCQFSDIMSKSYGLKTKMTHVEDSSEKTANKFRKKLKEILRDNKNFIVANFDGKSLGLKTNGHISLLAAYDEETDSVLVLDPALHKNMWYFTSVENLVKAMNTKDGEKYRGYVIVSK